MRTFPTWTHPLFYLLLPTLYKNSAYIIKAQKLLVPEIKRRQATPVSKSEQLTLLSWMIECADASESDPKRLAHLMIIVSLASIHTTQMNAVHCLYDLAANPQYLQPLLDEIEEVGKEGWHKSSYTKLRKLDSFLKESQRFNPPSLLSYHRVMKERYRLSDGFVLPKGAHICMAVNHIQNDPEVMPEPEKFDPFRYERKRQEPGETHLHQFATTANNSLNFGYGKYACPGRFFASLEIKNILAHLLQRYEFKLADGQGRPANLSAYEFVFPNPDAELMIRERQISVKDESGL